MLSLKQQKHLLYFDLDKKCFSSFIFQIRQKEDISEKKEKSKEGQLNDGPQVNGINLANISLADLMKLRVTFRLENGFSHKWQSDFYDLKVEQVWGQLPKMHKIPLSLQTYFALYKNPQEWKISLQLKPKYSDSKYDQKQIIGKIFKNQGTIGKLIITTNFSHVKKHEPFKIPVQIVQQKDINLEANKTVKIITLKDEEKVVCSGEMKEVQYCEKVGNFTLPQHEIKKPQQYKIHTFAINPRVNTQHICILKHTLHQLQFQFNKTLIRILSPIQPQFIPTLAKLFQNIRIMIQIQPITIIQHIPTTLQSCHGVVFFSDLLSLPQRIFRAYLFDKIQDRWLIEGMVNYSRSNKMFQDCMNELIELMNEGEEVFPLTNDQYYFDDVWKAKARFFFYVLANFKTTRDYGSSTLVGLILEYSKKKKINSTYLFRRLKKKYGLDGSFRSIYQQQFIKSTGLNRIFYQLIDIRRDNSVKFIIRQKSLLNKFFKTYNLYRIKLQQAYNLVSPLMQRIIKKNKYDQLSTKRKDLPGPLAVPQFIKCLPYFRGKMTVESDACEPFQLQLIQQNIIQKTKLSSSLRARPINRKPGNQDKSTDGFTWMMIDTAYVFPAIYKNQNVHENVILQRIKKIYQSQQQEIKVLNCISSTNHSQNQQICKALLQKLKMQPKAINTTLSVKRKILQIIPIFINKLKDSTIWQDFYALFKLYEPPCYDHSEDGYHFLTSLIQSSTTLVYKKQFSYYFNQLHRIMLAILASYQMPNSQQKQLKLKNLLYKSLMKWKSKYSFEVLKSIGEALQLMVLDVANNLGSIKVIVESLMRFLDEIRVGSQAKVQLIESVSGLIDKCIDQDCSGELYAMRFSYELAKEEKALNTIDFLRHAFKKIQQLQQDYLSTSHNNINNKQRYWLCLKSFKNVIQPNKLKYGLKIQLDELNQDQNYFLAEYLWCKLSSKAALIDSRIRLQWVKIYRIFYFYFTPIITLHKLKKSKQLGQDKTQFSTPQLQLQQLITCAQLSFIPQIRWLSGYDSNAAKQQKAKYQQYNLQNNRRKRKFEQLNFNQNNIITRFIKQNPGKDSWQDIARQGLRIIILIEEKKQVDSPQYAQRYKKIVEGLKNVQNYLKRGNMPNDYSLQRVRTNAQLVLRQYDEDTQKLQEIFVMVENAVESIRQQRRQKQIEKQNEMKIFIPKDWMMMDDDEVNPGNSTATASTNKDNNNNNINKSLQAIKQYPEQQGEDDQRMMMLRKINNRNGEDDDYQQDEYKKREDNQKENDQLLIGRYKSIFDE